MLVPAMQVQKAACFYLTKPVVSRNLFCQILASICASHLASNDENIDLHLFRGQERRPPAWLGQAVIVY